MAALMKEAETQQLLTPKLTPEQSWNPRIIDEEIAKLILFILC